MKYIILESTTQTVFERFKSYAKAEKRLEELDNLYGKGNFFGMMDKKALHDLRK